MSLFSIAFQNFKNNMKTYSMFFVAMVFSVVILSNFFILMSGEALAVLGDANAEYTKMVLQIVSVILAIFILFFIWYTSKVFLKNRKKEIGLYTFMGVDTKTIGKIYFLEMMLIGVTACILGIALGVLLSKFFQMIVFSMADFHVEVKFNVTMSAIVVTFIVFMVIFAIMSLSGFISIKRSKVIDLINANKKTEKMPKVNVGSFIIALISLTIILYGYYLIHVSRVNAFKTLLLVCAGTYGIFYALFPVILKVLMQKKSLIYRGDNIIVLNSLTYRIKKNYTTYATIGILTACTVTVLGTAVSMKNLYTMSEENDTLYSVSLSSKEPLDTNNLEAVMLSVGDKQYEVSEQVLKVTTDIKNKYGWYRESYMILSYQQLERILKENGNEKDLNKINPQMVEGNHVIYIQRPGTLASLIQEKTITIGDESYTVSESSLRLKTLGTLMNEVTLVVNDEVYKQMKLDAQTEYFYGIKVEDDESLLEESVYTNFKQNIAPFVNESTHAQIGIYEVESIVWLKIVYAIGAFLFLVFVLAEASIIYTKIFSDANEDREKYVILRKIGASKQDLQHAIHKEVAFLYVLPLLTGLVHSYFAIKVLGDFLAENLNQTFFISLIVCSIIFVVSYLMSVSSFQKIVGMNGKMR